MATALHTKLVEQTGLGYPEMELLEPAPPELALLALAFPELELLELAPPDLELLELLITTWVVVEAPPPPLAPPAPPSFSSPCAGFCPETCNTQATGTRPRTTRPRKAERVRAKEMQERTRKPPSLRNMGASNGQRVLLSTTRRQRTGGEGLSARPCFLWIWTRRMKHRSSALCVRNRSRTFFVTRCAQADGLACLAG